MGPTKGLSEKSLNRSLSSIHIHYNHTLTRALSSTSGRRTGLIIFNSPEVVQDLLLFRFADCSDVGQSWPASSEPSLRAGRRSTSGILYEQPGRALVWSIALVLKGERSHAPCQLHKILHPFCTIRAVPHQTSPAYLSAVITCCRTVPWHVRAGRRPPRPLALAVHESPRSPMVQNSRKMEAERQQHAFDAPSAQRDGISILSPALLREIRPSTDDWASTQAYAWMEVCPPLERCLRPSCAVFLQPAHPSRPSLWSLTGSAPLSRSPPLPPSPPSRRPAPSPPPPLSPSPSPSLSLSPSPSLSTSLSLSPSPPLSPCRRAAVATELRSPSPSPPSRRRHRSLAVAVARSLSPSLSPSPSLPPSVAVLIAVAAEPPSPPSRLRHRRSRRAAFPIAVAAEPPSPSPSLRGAALGSWSDVV